MMVNFFGKVMFIIQSFKKEGTSVEKNNLVTFKDLVEMIAKQIHADEKESKVGETETCRRCHFGFPLGIRVPFSFVGTWEPEASPSINGG